MFDRRYVQMENMRFLSLMIFLLLTTFGSSQNCGSTEDTYFFSFQSKSYEIVKSALTWPQAAACAAARGAKLAEIESEEENDAIHAAIMAANIDPNYVSVAGGGGIAYLWIGATDQGVEGQWVWDGDDDVLGDIFWIGDGSNGFGTGMALSYHNWGGSSYGFPAVPENQNGNQNAAGIALSEWDLGNDKIGQPGEWNDLPMNSQLYYILEFDCENSFTFDSISICSGDTLFINGDSITAEGLYELNFQNAEGCDSIVILDVTVLPVGTQTIPFTICQGDSLNVFGQTLFESGTYIFEDQTEDGCDATTTIILTVGEVYLDSIQVIECAGTPFQIAGNDITVSGTYIFGMQTALGCDSILVAEVIILPSLYDTTFAAICAGDTFYFRNDTFHLPGIYTYQFETNQGCDSIYVLDLRVDSIGYDTVQLVSCSNIPVIFGQDTLSVAGFYEFPFDTQGPCDSVLVVELIHLPAYADTVAVRLCDQDSFEFEDQVFFDSGIYTFEFVTEEGCDSIRILDLVLGKRDTVDVEISICDNEFYTFGNDTLQIAGLYSQIFTNASGCDSLVNLTLSVRPTSRDTVRVSICSNKAYEIEGQSFNQSGVYEIVSNTPNAQACDSIIVLELEVLRSTSDTTYATICGNETFSFDGRIFSEQGIYSFRYTNSVGCDSVLVLNLTKINGYVTEFSVDICEGETYNFVGQILSTTGRYQVTYIIGPRCDSLVILNLTVHPHVSNTYDIQLCAGEEFPLYGDTIRTSGVFNFMFQTQFGCDSLERWNVQFFEPTRDTIPVVICGFEAYIYQGDTLTESGTYTYELQSFIGCDSTVVIDLSFTNELRTDLVVRLCEGESYDFDGDILSTAGIYSKVYELNQRCDSIVTVDLSFGQPSEQELTVRVCRNEPYFFDGERLVTPGIYSKTLVSSFGCDSLVTIDFDIIGTAFVQETVTICANETYNFGGNILTMPGLYNRTSNPASGCDTIFTLILFVNPIYTSSRQMTLCEGETIFVDGVLINGPGFYNIRLKSVAGCDSIINLNVTEVRTPAIISNNDGNLIVTVDVRYLYQWINCDTNEPIPGEIFPNYTPDVTGNYTVRVRNGECVVTPDCVFVVVTSTSETEKLGIEVFPNPTQDRLIIRRGAIPQTATPVVIGADGVTHPVKFNTADDEIRVDVHMLPVGHYFIHWQNSPDPLPAIKFVKS